MTLQDIVKPHYLLQMFKHAVVIFCWWQKLVNWWGKVEMNLFFNL